MDRRTQIKYLAAIATLYPLQRLHAQTRTEAAGKKAEQKVIGFGLIAPRNTADTIKNWTPFVERLATHLRANIKPMAYAQQGALVEDFKSGVIDYAWVGNVPALELVEAGLGEIFGQLVVNGRASYRSMLIVPANSPIRSVDDLLSAKGRYVFSDGDVKSTSGHVVPRYFAFAKKGVNDPDSLFKEVKRGSHLENLNRIAKGEADIATANSTEIDLFRQTSPQLAGNVRVIWESPEIPESALVWRKSTSAVDRKKAQEFIVNFGRSAEERTFLKEMNNLTGLRKSSNMQLVPIADLEMFNARQRVMNDSKLTPDERTARIEEIIKRGSKLEFLLKRV